MFFKLLKVEIDNLTHYARAYFYGGITLVNEIGFEVSGGDRTRGKHRMATDCNTLVNYGQRTNPNAVFQYYVAGYQVERGFFVVMAAGE